jgi:hypothetical protein
MVTGSNKIAALNWRWRFQFDRHWSQLGFVSFDCSLTAPVSELQRPHHAAWKSVI